MSPNRHSISAVSTVKKLNTPLKASVVLLTAIILSSCATDGGDDTVTPKPSPILPTADAGGTSGSGTSGSETSGSGTSGSGTSGSGTSGSGTSDSGTSDSGTSDSGTSDSGTSDSETSGSGTSGSGTSGSGTSGSGTSGSGTSGSGTSGSGTSDGGTSGSNTGVVVTTNEIEKSIKAAEAKTKVAEEALKVAEARTKAAEDALRAAQERFGKESEKAAEAGKIAIETARAEVVQAKATAEAARAEAVAKIEAAAKASKEQVDAAKKTAAEAVAKVKNAEDKVKSADIRANLAESKAKEIEESLKAETAAKEAAEEAKEKAEQIAKDAKAQAELEKQKANDAKIEADKAKGELATAQQKLEAAEQALEDALASGGGNTEALQAEVARRQAALDAANAKATAAQQAQTQAAAAAAAQVAAANQAAQDAKDALAASQIKNAPEANKSGVQTLNVNVVPLSKVFKTTTRDFTAGENSVVARADLASQDPATPDQPGLLGALTITTSVNGDTAVAGSNGFKAHKDNAIVGALGQELPLAYTSTYKDFGDDMRIGHIDGTATFSGLELPVNGAAVIGNATQAANMPTEGRVGYTGDATYRKLGIGNAVEFGTSVFTADFVAKNVKGDLTFANAGKIALIAGITGNQFSGTAANNGGYATEGGFFGGDAQYLGGVYEGNGAQGTYGAKSDKQTAAEKAAKDAQDAANAVNAAIADAQAQAAAAKDAADKAQADALKAQEALAKAEESLANAGNGEDLLAAALERAEAAEAAQVAAEDLAAKSKIAQTAAETAQAAAQSALIAAQKAADKAVGEAKAKAEALVAQAKVDTDTANAAAALAQSEAKAAKAAGEKAKTDAATMVAVANAEKAKAEQAALAAKADADTANKLAADEKQKAATAQAAADKAKGELATAQEELAAAEKALADALASGGGNTEALQAEVDRRQAALDVANAKIIATEQAQAQANAAAAAQVAAAQQAQQAAEATLAAATIKNAPEAKKSGAQSINVGTTAAGLPSDFIVTTRDFEIGENNVIARADIASGDLLPKVDVNISGAGDKDLANGFKSHDDNTSITTALGVLPLTYTSVYKDYSDDMRIGHINGAANLQGTEIPVDGVAVVGNATQVANMPTEGKVGYTGDATYRKLGIGNGIEFGKSVFTADFVAKNVKGDLTFANAGKIGLTAGINGNQFSGTAADNDGYNTEGGFYGGDAQYLGGIYEGKGAQGTYGAKSDKQTAAEKAAKDAQAQAAAAEAAIAGAQAQAATANAAANKAKEEVAKAQTALEKAEAALANAGNSGDGGLAEALERAALAEAAEIAALKVAETAQAAKEAALLAQSSAEAAATAAQVAADKAIGEAKIEADKKVATANQQAAAAKEQAADAQKRADAADAAKLEAEARANAAEEALEAAQQLPPAPTNPVVAANATISGFQNSIVGSDNSAISANTSSNYDTLTTLFNQTGSGNLDKSLVLKLKDAADQDYEGGFKRGPLQALRTGGSLRTLKYTSAYRNFDNQMQIGHIYGDHKTSNNGIRLDLVSSVNVQGNSTNAADMKYMKDLSQYNINNKLNDGKVGYNGVASYLGSSEAEIIGKNPVIGTSEFKVDFVDSQVDGTLSFDGSNVSQKKIKAEIIGNTFAGNWNGVDTKGGFYGEDAKLLGGIYQVSGGKGTYGATKVDPGAAPAATESKMTGFQSTALSSKEKTLPFGLGQLDNAIGYVEIRDDASAWTELKTENGSQVPVDNGKGDNFTSFSKGKVLADMVKPDSVLKPIEVSLTNNGSVTVDAGKGGQNPTFKYSSVYKNFDSQMQVGHVYGNFDSLAGEVSRAANVYVEGYLTSQAGMDNLKTVNDGKAQYNGMATYIENIHLADNKSTVPVNGISAFDVDFVKGSVDGTLSFSGTDYKYMPTGNKINIAAEITGNAFAGNVNGIDTAGGFYGEDAKFLGGIYQDASVQGGKGTIAGTGTKFQGTFGAEKQ